ncbi:hypothetical protein EDB19DRAFT_1963646 [Suillus lakei]|nr:hypothetical protein EDB19DRAFT_1963646 [Suillus lakei]
MPEAPPAPLMASCNIRDTDHVPKGKAAPQRSCSRYGPGPEVDDLPKYSFKLASQSSTTHRLHPDPSVHPRHSTFAPSWGLRPRALLVRIPLLFHPSQPNADKPTEPQQRPGPTTFSRRSPPIVEVPALDDKKALYTARRTKRASDKVKRVKNPAWWARVVYFICYASSLTDDGR